MSITHPQKSELPQPSKRLLRYRRDVLDQVGDANPMPDLLPPGFDRGVWRAASTNSGATAIIGPDGESTTFGDLIGQAHRVAHALRALGLQTGDGVAVMAPNCVELIAVYLAAIETGLYFVPVNFHLVAGEVAYILDNSGTRVFLASERYAEVATKAADEVGLPADRRFSLGAVEGFRPFAELAANQPATFVENPTPGEAMSYTSGSTGRPKGVRRPLGKGDVLATYELTAALTLGPDARGGGVHLVCGPLYFRGPFIPALVALHLGQTLVLMDRWSAEGMLEKVEQHRVTSTYLVPTMIHRLLRVPADKRAGYDVASLTYVLHSAAPCPVQEKRELLEWLGPVVHETYGGTEGGGTYVSPQEWLERPGTIGRAWPGAEIHVLDETGQPCPPGVSGTVYIKPTSPDFGYHKDPAKTAAAKQGRLHTLGDIGYLDEDGYLFLHGRRSDLIISGGANIYPAEVEAAMLRHPDVGDLAVFGVPDADWGQRVHALVVPNPGVDGSNLIAQLDAHCRAHLAGYKVPTSFELRESLPRTSAGKLNKPSLQAPYWDEQVRT
jgi:long-chain acyl-CoA synthetase